MNFLSTTKPVTRAFYIAPLLSGLIFLFGFAADLRGQEPGATPTVSAESLPTPAQLQELLNALDLSLPALAPVRADVTKGDLAAAQHDLAHYFRARTSVPWKFDPRHPDKATLFDKQIADDAAKGRVKGGQIPVWANFPDGKIDWFYNETYHRTDVTRNAGWQWQLCRMDFWNDMAAAYRATGDEKYAKAWVGQMRSFIAQCPPPAEIPPHNTPSAWVPIDVGVRNLTAWPDSYFSFLLSPSVSDRDLLVDVYGFLINAQYLSTHHGPGNGFLMEQQGLYTIAAIFPEFKMSTTWRSQAVQAEMKQVAAMFLPDGVESELTTGYHSGAIANVMGLVKVAQIVGRSSEIPAAYIGPMEKAYEFEMYLMGPDRSLTKLNDSWPVHVQGLLREALPFFPGRKDFLWIASDGKEGQPPAETSKAYNNAGIYAMRSDWGLHGTFLVFRDGQFIFSHGHQDKLSVLMWAYGRELLFNSGGGPYDGSKWRQYSIDTFSKNTVLVDGLPQRRPRHTVEDTQQPAIDSRWESAADHDFVAGTYDEAYGDRGLHPAVQVRRVLFLKPDLGIVADTLTPTDTAAHSYQARWHLLTTHTQKIDGTQEIVTADAGQPNLDIVPLNPSGLDVRAASGQLAPELLGWNVLHYTVSQPAAATTVLQTRQGAGVQTFLTLLLPLPAGTSDPVKKVESTGPGAAKVTFNDGRTLAITADADPAGGIEATETKADGSPGRHVRAGFAHP
jgi:hypothetical protein